MHGNNTEKVVKNQIQLSFFSKTCNIHCGVLGLRANFVRMIHQGQMMISVVS